MAARISPDAELELTEQQIHDAAYLRADGRPWEAVAILLGLAGFAWLAVRRVAEADPRFAPALKRAAKGAAKEAEAVALRRLKAWSEKDDPKVSVKASEVLVEYAAEQLRNETKRKIERRRAETQREAIAAKQSKAEEEPEGPAPVWPTREEERAQIEQRQTEAAAEPNAEVYLWGGNHVTNVGVEPDATDQRVYIKWDHSFGRSVYWAIPEAAYLASGRGERPIRPEGMRETGVLTPHTLTPHTLTQAGGLG